MKSGLEKLVTYALKIEKQFNHPVDMEWCIDDKEGAILLQARPVTGLTGDDVTLWTNVNMVENFPRVVSPFAWSVIDEFYKYYMRNLLRLFGWSEQNIKKARDIVDNSTGIQAGRIYYNLSNWYESVYFLPIGNWLKKLLDNFIGQNVAYSFEPGISNKWVSKGLKNPLSCIMFWLHLLKICITAKFHINKFERVFFSRRKIWRKDTYNEISLENLLRILNDLLSNFVNKYYYNPGIVDIIAAIFPGILKILTDKWLPKFEKNIDLLSLQFLEGIDLKSTGSAKIISRMAQEIRKIGKFQELLLNKNYTELEKNMSSELKGLFEEFMHQFGGRCYHECMIVSPTFEERHDLFWDLVIEYQKASVISSNREKARKGNTKKLFKELPLLHRLIFWIVLKNAQRAITLRERSRIIRSLLLGEIRHITLAIGEKLVAKGHIANTEDVFYLKWQEIEDIAYGKFQFAETIPDLIKLRKMAEAQNEKLDPPGFFIRERSKYYEELKTVPDQSSFQDITNGIKGVGVSGGIIKGRVRVILDPVKDNTLEPGDILVTKTTDPGWTPLFKIAGGLILERGGMLSHGAIVAREFGIPAIVGVKGAATYIKNDTTILMNGNTGEIKILS